MYDKKAIRRRRAVLAILMVLSIVLLTGYFGEGNGGFFHGLQHSAQTVLSPVEEGASRAFKPVRDFVNTVGNWFSASGENKKLKQELQQDRRLLAQAQTAVRDDAQLKALVGLTRNASFPQDTRPVTARVIDKSPTVWWSTIGIDKGSDDGVKVDDPVITGAGLVGKVTSVTGGEAVVTLITDASSAVSAEVEPDGASGIVRPAVGNPSDMQLNFIQNGSKIKPGDVIVTSGFRSDGLESIFPRGIPIGSVKSVSTNELQIYQLVHVQPWADFHRVDFVQVLTASAPTSQANAGGTAGP
ncbi:MAG TPA: rod shape-determining protein MreC [Mycobacteriales bacterium]|nr:rod shape-determining protein MreC [Mycobacteriales bacterium]